MLIRRLSFSDAAGVVRRLVGTPQQESPYSTKITLRARVEHDDLDSVWVAECLTLPGVVSDGETRDAALRNLTEAITEAIEVRHSLGMPIYSEPVETIEVSSFMRTHGSEVSDLGESVELVV